MSASTPCLAHSWIAVPFIWAAVGGLPETIRAFSTFMAFEPAPPATAKSFHSLPCLTMSSLRTAAALDSPPEVHQCSTSSVSARAGKDAIASAAAPARRESFMCVVSNVWERKASRGASVLAPAKDLLLLDAESVDAQAHHVTGLQVRRRLHAQAHAGRSAGRDHVAGLELDVLTDVRHQ